MPVGGARIRKAGVDGGLPKQHTHRRGLGMDHLPDGDQGVHRQAEEERFVFGDPHLVRTRRRWRRGARERIKGCPDVGLQSLPIVFPYFNA